MVWQLSSSIVCLSFILGSTALIKPGKHYIQWDGSMRPCEGITYSAFDLQNLVISMKDKFVLALKGDAALKENTSNHIKFRLTIYKEINGNYEFYTTYEEPDLCKHIPEKNKPWTPFVDEMGIKSCPIQQKTYSFKSSTLDTAGFPLNAALAGNYRGKIETFDGERKTVCLLVEASVKPA